MNERGHGPHAHAARVAEIRIEPNDVGESYIAGFNLRSAEMGCLIFFTISLGHCFCFDPRGKAWSRQGLMFKLRSLKGLPPLVLWSALCWVAAAQSSPISGNGVAESTERPTQQYPRMSEADLVLSDPRLELRPELGVLELATDRRGGGIPVRRGSGAPGDTDGIAGPDSGTWLGGLAVRDALRGYVNAPRGSAVQESGADRRRGPQGEPLGLAGVDLGPAANEWIQETVQNILSSALQLDVNDRGQTSFSVLGLGEFSVHLSADRSEVALTSGETVLVTAKRAPEAGGPGYGGSYGNGGWDSSGTVITPGSSVAGESPLRQALELAMELASHPLSFLVYGVILAYFLLWSILSRRARSHQVLRAQYSPTPTSRSTGTSRKSASRRRRHRSRPSTHRA